jgi:5S rRNA maturation endonuclease (ribonuclease M5)
VNYFEAVGLVRLTDYSVERRDFDLDLSWDVKRPPEEFLSRGITEETLEHFRIGTTSDGRIVIPYYKDFSKPTVLLGYQTREYRGDLRIVRNSKGFDRDGYLYNYSPKEFSYTVLVEGQSDVLRLFQFGYNATALMGSHVSKAQVGMLSKFDKVYLALDNDLPGRQATEEVYALLKDHVNIRLVPYVTKDPCECTSKKEWETAFLSSTDYMQYTLEMSQSWPDYLDMKDKVLRLLAKRDDL